MSDRALVMNLWAHLQAELTKLDNVEVHVRNFSHTNYVACASTFADTRIKILSMMERLATVGDVTPDEVAKAKTSWEKINNGEGP